MARKSEMSAYLMVIYEPRKSFVSEVDLMNAIYLLSFRRRIEDSGLNALSY